MNAAAIVRSVGSKVPNRTDSAARRETGIPVRTDPAAEPAAKTIATVSAPGLARVAFAIFIIAFALRMFHYADLRQSPLFDSPIMDARYNDEWARAIAAGQDPEPVFFRAPLYPYFLATVYKLLPDGYGAARVVQFLIGSVSCALVYLLGRRLFGETPGRLAGLIAAAYGVFIYFEGELLVPVLEIFLGLLLIHAALSYDKRRTLRTAFVMGALLGLFALARPNVLLPGFAALIWIAAPARRRNVRTPLRHGAAFVIGGLLLIAPAALHNRIRGHDWVLVASQGGVNFFIGNNPDSDGVLAALPEVGDSWEATYDAADRHAARRSGRELRPSEASGYWTARGLEFIRTHPGQAASLLWRKLRYFWVAQELPNNKNIYFFARQSSVLRHLLIERPVHIPFLLIGPLAVIGMLAAWRRNPRSRPVSGFVLAYMASVIVFFVNSRFRAPVLPALISFAAFGAAEVVAAVRRGALRRRLAMIGGFLLLAVLMDSVSYGDPSVDESSSHNKIGIAHRQAGRTEAAIQSFREAVRIQPANDSARTNLAAALLDLDRATEAIAVLEAGLAYPGGGPRLQFSLGVAWHRQGDVAKALAHFEAAAAADDEYLEAHNNLGALYFQTGAYEPARTHFMRAAQLDPSSYRPWFNLGLCQAQLGVPGDAARSFRRALELRPDLNPANLHLGLALVHSGQVEEGRSRLRTFLERAASNDPGRSRAEAALGTPPPPP